MTCIIWILESVSVGRISTTLYECLWRAIDVFAFNFSLSRVLKTLTNNVEPPLEFIKA